MNEPTNADRGRPEEALSDRPVSGLLQELVRSVRGVLDAKLAGLYLFGSLALGDFDVQVSDIDLLAILSADLSDEELAAVEQLHAGFAQSHPEWEDRIEVAYISAGALGSFKTMAYKAAVISPGEPFHVVTGAPHWLIDFYAIREQGRALIGPDPKTVIQAISRTELIQTVKDDMVLWPGRVAVSMPRKAYAYAVLTLCRDLYVLRYGRQTSKKGAARWAIGLFPQWSGLIRDALLWRSQVGDEEADPAVIYPDTLQFAEFASRMAQATR